MTHKWACFDYIIEEGYTCQSTWVFGHKLHALIMCFQYAAFLILCRNLYENYSVSKR